MVSPSLKPLAWFSFRLFFIQFKEIVKKNPAYRRQQVSRRARMVAPLQKGKSKTTFEQLLKTCATALWNTPLTIDLPYPGTPYLPWTCATEENPLTMDLPHRGTPYSRWTSPGIMNLPHCKTTYSPWTFPTAKHPSHSGPSPVRNTILTLDLPHVEQPTYSTGEKL